MGNQNIFGKVILGACGVLGIILVAALIGSGYTVDQSARAVILRLGALSKVTDPGWHPKIPFVDTVHMVSLRNKLWRVDKPQEGYSHDQQSAHYVISVQYQINATKVADAYVNYGGEAGVVQTLLIPNILKLSKVVIGQFTAQTSVQERGKLNQAVTDAMQEAVEGTPLLVTSVNVEDIQFGVEYMKSINDRMVAEVRVQTSKQNLENEKVLAQITVTKAQADADSKLAVAKAEAQGIEIKGTAEGKSIQARGAALGQNPSLVQLTAAEKWNGIMPTHMIPGGATPLLNLNSEGQPRTAAR